MKLLGHRGARLYAPENTLAAFDLALAHGCDGFEFDVRRTADAQCILCHGPRLAGLEIAGSRLADLVDACPPAPTLPDVLRLFSGRAFLDIELKVAGLEAETAALLRRYPPSRGFFVSSFLPNVVESLHREDPSLPLGLICDTRRQLAAWPALPITALFLARRLATARTVNDLRQSGKQVFVWTVNRERDMRHFAELGVDGIISDDTRTLAQVLNPDAVSS